MNKNTKEIVSLIAGIQIEALTRLKGEYKQGKGSHELLRILLQIQDDEIEYAIDNLIEIYLQIERFPALIKTLNEYQLYICSHILYKMEDEWLLENSEGVFECWQLLRLASAKFHPELSLFKL